MSDIVTIPFGDNAQDTAVLLLAAVEDLDLSPAVVTTGSFGNFFAPREVADAAGVDYIDDDAVDNPPMADLGTTFEDAPLVTTEDGQDEIVEPEVEAYDPSAHNVEEVLAYLAENPDQRPAIILAEQQGKNRVTITESQE